MSLFLIRLVLTSFSQRSRTIFVNKLMNLSKYLIKQNKEYIESIFHQIVGFLLKPTIQREANDLAKY